MAETKVTKNELSIPGTTWSPTWTGLTVGNGTLTALYTQVDKRVDVFLRFTLGSTSAITGSPTFTLPVTAHSSYNTPGNVLAIGYCEDAGVTSAAISIILDSSTTIGSLRAVKSDATYLALPNSISSTVPFTWGTSDFFNISFSYITA